MKRRSVVGPLGLAVLSTLAGGCASYESRPLDLDVHRESFLSRGVDAEPLAVYAQRLRMERQFAGEFDPSDGITLEEAEVVALVFNADLRVARLEAGIVAATAENSGLWEDPVLGADFTRITESVPHPWKSFVSLGFTIPISGRLALEKARANAEADAELERLVQAEWETRVELRRRWIAWASAERRCEVMSSYLSRLGEVVDVANKSEDAGEMPRIEARLFRLERATRSMTLSALEAQRDAALIAVKESMGLAPTSDVPLMIESSVQSRRDAAFVRTAIDAGEVQRLAVARAAYETAERALELQVRKQFPDIVIGPGYGREEGQDQVLLGISMPLPIFNRNQQAIAEAEAQRDAARGIFEQAYECLVYELTMAESHHAAAVKQRETLEQTIVPMVDEQYSDARKVASLGEVNTLVLLESITRQVEAKLALIDAVGNEALAAIEVDALAGPDDTSGESEGDMP